MSDRKLPRIITLKSQPEFPTEDISSENAAVAGHYLENAPEVSAYYQAHHDTLQVVHDIGNAALVWADLSPRNNKEEYQAFCQGFSNIDYLATLLDSRRHMQLADGAGMQYFYLQHGDMIDVELSKRRRSWAESHQNTMELLSRMSDRRNESAKAFAARALGAQAASEMLYTVA